MPQKRGRAVGREQREARVADDRCPECDGSLDTGWECNDCGFDAMSLVRPDSNIEESFKSYLEKCFGGPSNLSETQVSELRKAFFAGAWHVLCANPEIDNRTANDMRFECQQFVRKLA